MATPDTAMQHSKQVTTLVADGMQAKVSVHGPGEAVSFGLRARHIQLHPPISHSESMDCTRGALIHACEGCDWHLQVKEMGGGSLDWSALALAARKQAGLSTAPLN